MEAATFAGFEATAPAAPAAPAEPLATERQYGFIDDLARRKTLSPDQLSWLEGEKHGLSKKRASQVIDRLLALADKPRDFTEMLNNGPGGEVPDGYYALEGVEGYRNEVNFFRLNTGKQGRWEGFQFIDHIVAGGHDHPIKGEGRKKVYEAILAEGINEARQRYGREIGRCGVCGRMLTDDNSRALGIGPVCAEGF